MECELRIKELYNKYKDRYVFRFRKDKTIVYYKGIKTFELFENKKSKLVTLKPSENTFKCNPTGMCSDIEKEEYIQNLKKLNRDLRGKMTGIKFKIAKKGDLSTILSGYQKFEEYCKNNISKELFDFDDVRDKISDTYYKDNYIKIKFNKPLIDMEKIIDLQYNFYDNLRIDNKSCPTNRIKNTKFDFEIIIDVKSFDDFITVCENAIDNYNGKGCIEKKYQHQFMLVGDKASLFEKNKKIIPFEEEYPIGKNENKSNGRIDCVFCSAQDNNITEIYLIEIKVDDTVILGDNGVLTHLDDIKNELDNIKKKDEFVNRIKDHINYSNQIIDISKMRLELSSNYKVHFYTIFGYTDENQPKKIKNTLRSLNNSNSIADYCKRNKLPKKYKDKTINDFVSKSNSYDIKFFIEEKMWQIDDVISEKFIDITEYIMKNNH